MAALGLGVPMTGHDLGLVRGIKSLRRAFSRMLKDPRGNVAAITALLMLPMLGGFALATEASGWYLINRVAQNAADSAALAAASNNDYAAGGTGYITEGKGVAASYGFKDGTSAATVSVTFDPTAPLPDCVANGGCYVATVTKSVSLFFSQIVGYGGNTTFGNGRGQLIRAGALAVPKIETVDYCLTALSGGSSTITFNGFSMGDLSNCALRSNGDVKCNGNNYNFRSITYGGTDQNCDPGYKNAAPITDPYNPAPSGMYTIPSNPCMTYYAEGNGNGAASALPASNKLTQVGGISSTPYCGDVALNEDVTISSNQVLVIENGRLDLNGHTLSTTSGGGLAVVFSGTSGSYSHYPMSSASGGVLNIAAPTSGTWSGVALWQDPSLTAGLDMTFSGNNPTFDLTGLVYAPKANITINGAIDKATSGVNCFSLVAYTVTISGTGSIYSNTTSQCQAAGLTTPQGLALVGAKLIY